MNHNQQITLDHINFSVGLILQSSSYCDIVCILLDSASHHREFGWWSASRLAFARERRTVLAANRMINGVEANKKVFLSVKEE